MAGKFTGVHTVGLRRKYSLTRLLSIWNKREPLFTENWR